MELLQRRRLRAGGGGGGRPERVEVETGLARLLTLEPAEDRRLEVREHRSQALGSERVVGGGHGGLLAGDERGRDERLCLVGTAPSRARCHRRPAEAEDPELAVDDGKVVLVELPMADARVVEVVDDSPDPGDQPGRPVLGHDVGQPGAVAAEHEERVVADRCAGGDDPVGPDACLAGEEGHERLVLRLLESSEADRRVGVAEPDGTPHRRHERRRRGHRVRRP